MTFELPVWYLQGGRIDAAGKFEVLSQASGVAVAVRKGGGKDVLKLLLTVQHALRSKTDPPSGDYHPAYRAWPPNYGYNDGTAFPVTMVDDLIPSSAKPFAEAEDLAFLQLPPRAAGQRPPRLLNDEALEAGLGDLSVAGYISGQDLLANHNGKVEYALGDGWWVRSADFVTGMCILGSGTGPPGPGVSGGGVFRGEELAGIYRGRFQTTGEHFFLSVRTVRDWCGLRGYKLIDRYDVEITQGIRTYAELPRQRSREQASSDAKMIAQLRSDLSLFECYKDLHDTLHQVQQNLPPLAKNVKKLMSRAGGVSTSPDPESADLVDDGLSTFAYHARNAEKAIATMPASAPTLRLEEQEWSKKLAEAIELGRTGLARSEPASCRQAVQAVRSILRRHMPRINSKLKLCAEAMNLEGLSAFFARGSALPGISSEAAKTFDSSRRSTEQISDRLRAQLKLHDEWQDVDVNLWETEDALAQSSPQDSGDFDALWDGIYKKLEKLIASETATQWALTLPRLANEVERLRKQQDWPGLRKAFPEMQEACRKRFNGVDTNLRNLAADVAAMGDSLDTLL